MIFRGPALVGPLKKPSGEAIWGNRADPCCKSTSVHFPDAGGLDWRLPVTRRHREDTAASRSDALESREVADGDATLVGLRRSQRRR
jgi:hypothetical protein